GGLFARVVLAEKVERIAKAVALAEPGLGALALVVGRGRVARPPGRAMAGERILLPAGDFGVLHAVEVVVGLVILLDMFEAERAKLALVPASLRRAVASGLLAGRPFAGGIGGAPQPFRPGLHADLVEVF